MAGVGRSMLQQGDSKSFHGIFVLCVCVCVRRGEKIVGAIFLQYLPLFSAPAHKREGREEQRGEEKTAQE